jgi:acyl-CoA reductase-like NAD-dependent aldehyde dehydrogenase
MLIGGSWIGPTEGRSMKLINPATEDPIDTVAYGDETDVERAIGAAAVAADRWRSVGPYARADILHRAASLLRERADAYGLLTSEESGKPLTEARAEWLSAPTYLEFAAEEAKRIGGRLIPSRRLGRRIEVGYEPLGVIGVIAAWNFPVYNVNRAVSSALAAGCTVVVRPSEYTPRSAFAYAEALIDAGLPPGVLNVVNGHAHEMAQTMLDDPRLRKIQFTGSTRVGKILMDGASRTVTQLSLELGGNAPVIVMPDVRDLAAVVNGGVTAKYRNGGQACIAPQRFIVHESIAEDFIAMAAAKSSSLTVGDPLAEATDIGPLINATQRDRVEAIVGATVDAGGTVSAGGGRVSGRGYFFEPTVLSGGIDTTPAMTEEIFGPVLPITTFATLDEAIRVANVTEHGLSGFVWTSDLRAAIDISDRLEFGMIGINDWYPVAAEAPFGGMKQSGLGRESGTEGVLEYMETKTKYFGDLG